MARNAGYPVGPADVDDRNVPKPGAETAGRTLRA